MGRDGSQACAGAALPKAAKPAAPPMMCLRDSILVFPLFQLALIIPLRQGWCHAWITDTQTELVGDISWPITTHAAHTARRMDAGERSRFLAAENCDVTAGCTAFTCGLGKVT
jgi:hypothetical protein